jgi:hypothetical protein
MTTILIASVAVYLVCFIVGNAPRCNPWNITLADRLLWFPLDGALVIIGKVIG